VSEADINANASGAIADRGGLGLNELLGRTLANLKYIAFWVTGVAYAKSRAIPQFRKNLAAQLSRRNPGGGNTGHRKEEFERSIVTAPRRRRNLDPRSDVWGNGMYKELDVLALKNNQLLGIFQARQSQDALVEVRNTIDFFCEHQKAGLSGTRHQTLLEPVVLPNA
jgi:hypothetical protein